MLLHVVKETDKGIIVKGAKYETAAAYANQAFTKPTIANWGDAKLSDYAVGFICDLNSPNLKFTYLIIRVLKIFLLEVPPACCALDFRFV